MKYISLIMTIVSLIGEFIGLYKKDHLFLISQQVSFFGWLILYELEK